MSPPDWLNRGMSLGVSRLSGQKSTKNDEKKLSKEDVIKLLGEPNNLGSTSFDYKIGWCTYIDPNSLRIDFDENGLLKAYILNH